MKQWPQVVSVLLAVLISLGTLTLALTFSYLRHKANFLELTTTLQRRIEASISELADPAEQCSAFYQAMPRIQGDDFRLFSERIMGRFSFVSGLLFAPRVTQSERRAFEDSWREEGLVTFSIHDSAAGSIAQPYERGVYFPVLYIEPLRPEYASFMGLDIGDRQDFSGVFSQAAHTDKTLIVNSAGLLDQTREYWLVRAVYRGRDALPSDASRAVNAAGMMLLRVDPSMVVERVLKEADTAQVGFSLLIDNGENISTVIDPQTTQERGWHVKLNSTERFRPLGATFITHFRQRLPISTLFFNGTTILATVVGALLSLTLMILSREYCRRQRACADLDRSNVELRAISSCNQTLIRAQDEQSLLDEICRIVCTEAGYRMAWVGYAENDALKSIKPVAWAGIEEGYLQQAGITWADTDGGGGPSCTAIRSGRSTCIQDFMTDLAAGPWRDSALQRGYRSSIALPLKDETDQTIGVLNIYSAKPKAFMSADIRLLEELAGDLAFGIAVLRARKAREKDLHRIALQSFALNNVQEAAFLIDENARLHYVNEASCRALGYPREELLDLSITQIDPDFPAQRWPAHWHQLKAQQTLTFEGRHQAKDGHTIPVEINANYFEYDGRGYNLALVRDISERKQMERERLANLKFFESMDRINRVIQSAPDIDTMMSDALDAVLSILDCDRAYMMYPCDPETDSWTSPMERCKPEYPGALTMGVDVPMTSEIAETLRIMLDSDGPVKFGPGTDHPLPSDVSERFGFKCFMAMALYPKGGKPWQFGIHQCSHARIWTLEEERLFKEIGRRLADGLTSWLTFRDLEKSEAQYRRIVNTANEGIWMVDEGIKTTYVNDRMASMLGYAVQEMIGRPTTDFVHEQERADQLKKHEARCHGLPENYERRFRCKDGQILWALVSVTPVFDDNHQYTGSFAMVTDITSKKLAEEDLQRLNKELESRIVERTRELAASHAELEKAYHDLKATQSRMLQQEKMASIGQLAAGVAHEINNPLAFVISNLNSLGAYSDELVTYLGEQEKTIQSMADASSNEGLSLLTKLGKLREGADIDFILDDIKQIVGESLDGSDRMKQIVQNLKSFARLNEAEYTLADLNQGLESTLNIVWNELKYKATVKKSYGEIPETMCNPGQLNQVFMNLLVNAAQAIEKQGQIEVETRWEGEVIVIDIADTGCGIPEDKLNRIFEPFFTTKEVGKGTGLGLSISFDIIEKHGGEISVQSQPGHGTRFTISLPVRAS